MPKYAGRELIENEEDSYKELLDEREVDFIEHYETFFFKRRHLMSKYSSYSHVWKRGDKLYKLAYNYYGSLKFWWIIALWNRKPTDAHYKVGDVIQVPFPAEEIYSDLIG